MFHKALLLAAMAGAMLIAQNPVRQVTYRGLKTANKPIPVFDKGYVIEREDMLGTLSVYSPDGNLLYETNVLAPDGTAAYVRGAAVDADGTVAVPIFYGKQKSYRNGIVYLGQEGRQILFVDTGLFAPSKVCFAGDHSTWAIGWNEGNPADGAQVRRYSPDGKETGSFLPRSLFPPGLSPFGSGISTMHAIGDRIGLLAFPGQVSDHPEWVELGLDGKVIGRWQLGLQQLPMELAFTEDGSLYWYALQPETKKMALLRFDRGTSTWNVVVSPDASGLLLGADENTLVYETADAEGAHLSWINPPPVLNTATR